MLKIIELEINNLSTEQKEELLKILSFEDKSESSKDKYPRRIHVDQNDDTKKKYFFEGYDNSENQYYNDLDEVLKAYFKDYIDDFINFQKGFEDSLYNQTIKKHGFQDLSYQDVLEGLNKQQKTSIIWKNINEMLFVLSDKGLFNKDKGLFNDGISLWHIDPEDKTKIKSLQRVTLHDWEWKYDFIGFPSNLEEWVDQYQNNQYFLAQRLEENDIYTTLKFFKDENELILFALKQPKIAPYILDQYEELLNPHHQVNRWIVKNHKLELAQKDIAE
ncbi:hypothetical protein [Mesomycoplasma ovipneumoniae]|uniref:hypothetical protein n=1 Tax=Mesomycoplasma ovipneumoniae TaxID=29562 RepID=UPI00083E76EC|nr:hypothetical protein [Mesomycoplasma ovipneumoniae]